MPEVIQRAFSSGELSPSLFGRADLAWYQSGLATCRNFIVQAEGGIESRGGLEFVGYVEGNDANVRIIPFQFNVEQTYVLVFTDNTLRIVSNGSYIVESSTPAINAISVTSPPGTADIQITTSFPHGFSTGDAVILTSVGGLSELNGYVGTITVTDTAIFTLDDTADLEFTTGPYTSGGIIQKIYTVASPYAGEDLSLLKYTQSADVMTIVHPSYAPRELSRDAGGIFSFAIIDYGPTVTPPVISSGTGGGSGGGSDTKTYEYVVTAVDANGVESEASAPQTVSSISSLSETYYVILAWGAVAGADKYNIYKAESDGSDVYGYIGTSKALTFKDYNIRPDVTDTPPIDKQPFGDPAADALDTNPSTANYYQQRLIFGRTNAQPQTVFTTESGNYKSLRTSEPTRASDAIEFTIASRQVNEIRHIVSLDALLVLTSGGEYKVTEGQEDVLTPASVGVRPQTYFGCNDVTPVVVGNTALYIQERGNRVRDVSYTFESDSYGGADLSIKAQHLFDGYQITNMAYAQEPDTVVWMTRDDGTLLGLTYHREQQIWAWHRHDTQGEILDVATISEGDVNAVYVVTERDIGGVQTRYIERLKKRDWSVAEDAFCVDSGLTYDGEATTTIYGLWHLEGKELVALADGVAIRGLTVSNGAVTLQREAEKVHLGLSYNCDMQTLDMDPGRMNARGKRKTTGELVIKFYESRGGYAGPDEESLTEIRPRLQSDNYDPIQLRSYEALHRLNGKWTENGRIFIRQSDPVPMTILAVMPEFSIG